MKSTHPSATSPPRAETYCGQCRDTKPHYLSLEWSNDKRDCYECGGCKRLVFSLRLTK